MKTCYLGMNLPIWKTQKDNPKNGQITFGLTVQLRPDSAVERSPKLTAQFLTVYDKHPIQEPAMNVASEARVRPTYPHLRTNFVRYVLIYPLGIIPAGMELPEPEVYTPGQIHQYHWQFQNTDPDVGKTVDLAGLRWTIRALEHYKAAHDDGLPTKSVYVAYCTCDGSPAKPYDWDNDPPIPYVIFDANWEKDDETSEPWGWIEEGTLEMHFAKSARSLTINAGVRQIQTFKPVDAVCPEYRIYWA